MPAFAPACRTALALTLALSPAARADEIPGSQYALDYWSGAAFTDDRGAFSHCSLSVAYVEGGTLWLGLYANDTLSVLLSDPRVRFRTGETFDSWLLFETGLPTRGVSEAWDEYFAGMTLEGIDASIEFLSYGQYLRLLGIGIDEAFDVTGLPQALELARTCHARNSGRNPFAVANPQPAEIAPEPEPEPQPLPDPVADLGADPGADSVAGSGQPALGTAPPLPKVPDLTPKPGGGVGTRPGGALGTPAPKPAP